MGGGLSVAPLQYSSIKSGTDSAGTKPSIDYFNRINRYKSEHSTADAADGANEDISDDSLEFRVLLDEPTAIKSLETFCTADAKQFLEAWMLLNDKQMSPEFRIVHDLLSDLCSKHELFASFNTRIELAKADSLKETDASKRGAGGTTYDTDSSITGLHLRARTSSFLHSLESRFQERFRTRKMMNTYDADLEGVRKDMIMACFKHLYSTVYIPFRGSPMYEELFNALQNANTVSEWDFDFFTRMGSGGFGSIFSCRKRSTGAMYAMKIQPKALLLRNCKRGNKHDVMIEALACTSCRHPYICEAEYAFQNSKLVFLAMPIYACGDLRRALLMEPSGCFSRDRAQFYIAVVASVLMYLHTHGLIYRDLKPENLLLHSDGHIALCDLGSIAGKNAMSHCVFMADCSLIIVLFLCCR